MTQSVSNQQRFSIHGFELVLWNDLPQLSQSLSAVLGDFPATASAAPQASLVGTIKPFDQRDVLRHLSPTATKVATEDHLMELFQENERSWRIDDRWGICEMNLLKGRWRSWVLPKPRANSFEVVEQAVLWPMSQLLRPRGLCLIPGVAVVRDGFGTLILSRFSIEPELKAMLRTGYRVVGQSWVAIREEAGRLKLCYMPGPIQRAGGEERIDLAGEFCGSMSESAPCDMVMLVAHGRRPSSRLQLVTGPNALGELRRAWPITDLRPQHRPTRLLSRMAVDCTIFNIELSRNSSDMIRLIDQARMLCLRRVTVTTHVQNRATRLVA